MSKDILTKEIIDSISYHINKNKMHRHGSVLFLRKDTVVPKDIIDYAKHKNIDVVFEKEDVDLLENKASYSSLNFKSK